jgi:hypothetical protein
VLHCAALCCAGLRNAAPFCGVFPYVVLRSVVLCCVLFCRAVPSYCVLCCAVSCCDELRFVVFVLIRLVALSGIVLPCLVMCCVFSHPCYVLVCCTGMCFVAVFRRVV